MNIENKPNAGSHLPVLIKIVGMTEGPILELGIGTFSTPFLHWACFPDRRLVSYEHDAEFVKFFNRYNYDFHEIYHAEDWDKIDISGHWSIAFIDHAPKERRKEEIRRLADTTDYIIVHDSEGSRDSQYHMSEIYHLFKYRYNFIKARHPFTTVFSNLKDLSELENLWK